MTYTVSSTVKPRLRPPCFKIRSPRCYDHFILVQSKAQSIISRCLWPSVGDRINEIRRLMRNSEAEGETCLKFIFLLLARKSKEKAEKNLTIECRRLFLSHMFPKRAWKWLLGWVPLGRSGSGFMICDQSDYAPPPPCIIRGFLWCTRIIVILGLNLDQDFLKGKKPYLGVSAEEREPMYVQKLLLSPI